MDVPPPCKARLLVGNSVYGRHSWSGDIYGLAFYGKTLPARDVARHSNRWFKDQTFLFAKKENPFVLYLFDEKGGSRALDHAGKNHHLQIPSRMQILKKGILLPVWKGLEFNRSSIQDIIINLVGFIPFGFILIATLINLGGAFQKHCVLITVALGFTFSLIIEIVQALMPSRSSQLLDLFLNTLSALIGTVIYKKCTSSYITKELPTRL